MRIVLKIISFFAGCFIIFLIAICSNSEWFDKASRYFPSPFRYGDLYRMTTTPGFRIKKNTDKFPSPSPLKDKNMTLTIIGDSYSNGIDTSCYYAGGGYRFIHWNQITDTIPAPDSTKKNVLIIECTERLARYFLRQSGLVVIGKKTILPQTPKSEWLCEKSLQYKLTNFDFELPFRELKTNIYLNWFNKYDSLVEKPDGSGRLFLKETVDPEMKPSSFNPVSDQEVDSIVENLNDVEKEFNALGFCKVYVSIIPNSASIYKTSNVPYNHIIERIEQSPKANVEMIDIYKKLKEEKHSVYYLNDTHWNSLGKVLWLIEVNRKLMREH